MELMLRGVALKLLEIELISITFLQILMIVDIYNNIEQTTDTYKYFILIPKISLKKTNP
jgi:hypothetical protein